MAPRFDEMRSNEFEVGCRAFAVPANFGLEADRLTFAKTRQPATLDRRDVDEHIGATIIARNKPVSLLSVEPLYRSGSHEDSFDEVDDRASIT